MLSQVSIQFRGEWPNYSCFVYVIIILQLPIYTFIVMRGCVILLEQQQTSSGFPVKMSCIHRSRTPAAEVDTVVKFRFRLNTFGWKMTSGDFKCCT